MEKSLDELQIQKALEGFVKAWETGKTGSLNDYVVEEPYVYFSMQNTNYYDRDTLKVMVGNLNKDADGAKFYLENEVCLIENEKAHQYAVLLGILTGKAGRHLGIGGIFTNVLAKEDGEWKLETIRFELREESSLEAEVLTEKGLWEKTVGIGDASLIKDWKFPKNEAGFFMNQVEMEGRHVVLGELDAPWYCVKNRENPGDDESQISELFSRYCFAYDVDSFLLMKEIFTEDAELEFPQTGILELEDAIGILKLHRQGVSRSLHTGTIKELEIKDNLAMCRVVRNAPEKLCLIEEKDGNLKVDFGYGEYELLCKKQNNHWKIYKMSYEEKGKEGGEPHDR